MKLKNEFIVHETDHETLLVSTGAAGFSGLVKGNKTLGAILQLLKTDTTENAVVSALKERFDAQEEIIRADVQKALSGLREIGALDE